MKMCENMEKRIDTKQIEKLSREVFDLTRLHDYRNIFLFDDEENWNNITNHDNVYT